MLQSQGFKTKNKYKTGTKKLEQELIINLSGDKTQTTKRLDEYDLIALILAKTLLKHALI